MPQRKLVVAGERTCSAGSWAVHTKWPAPCVVWRRAGNTGGVEEALASAPPRRRPGQQSTPTAHTKSTPTFSAAFAEPAVMRRWRWRRCGQQSVGKALSVSVPRPCSAASAAPHSPSCSAASAAPHSPSCSAASAAPHSPSCSAASAAPHSPSCSAALVPHFTHPARALITSLLDGTIVPATCAGAAAVCRQPLRQRGWRKWQRRWRRRWRQHADAPPLGWPACGLCSVGAFGRGALLAARHQ
eukprot:352240-Chlamydomonas_euryale.AAC.1